MLTQLEKNVQTLKAADAWTMKIQDYNKLMASSRKTENGKHFVKVNGQWRPANLVRN